MVDLDVLVNGTAISDANPVPAHDTAAGTQLAAILTKLAAVGLDAAALAALESITIGGTVALDAPTLAALESITATVSGTVAISGTVPVSGPQTDAQARATPQPVSGTVTVSNPTANPETGLAKDATFTKNADGGIRTHVENLPATQPVSAAALPLPAGAAQDGSDITAPTAMPAGGVGIRGWLSAIWTKLNGSLAVTGTFWQATQPISGAVTVSDARVLTERMLAKAPSTGYHLWLDPADATYTYVMEAPDGSASSAAVFRGIRLANTTAGAVATTTGASWDARAAATWVS